ncbi:MAG: thioredoxin domain-containing protein [Candidatus Vogelbacteria bacterium]|nr:thioredoxin domain-containing protein [Candidatus Vogelbacteria bacterium]
MDENNKPSPYAIPGAIVIAGLIIAGAVYYKGNGPVTGSGGQPAAVGANEQNAALEKMRPIDAADHLLGNPNAPIKIVEYSDLECPFCKNFHATMHQLVTAYPEQVAWVYRHFPLDQLHNKARKEAEASECAYELGGPSGSEASNEKFWAYVDKIFEVTPSNDRLEPSQLPLIAEQIGLNRQTFETCLASGRQAERVDADYQNALDAGGRGTPFPIVIAPDGKKFALEGAVPFEGMKQLVEGLLAK